MSAPRLRALFVHEARGRLETLTDALLEVEARVGDPGADVVHEALDRILRETHSLKGSAAMVGFPEVGREAHDMEESVGRVRRGETGLTAEVVDGLLAGVDRIRALLGEGQGRGEGEGDRTDPHPTMVDRPPAVADADAVIAERLGVDLERLDDMVHLSGDVRSGLYRLRTLLGEHPTDAQIDVLRDLERTGRSLQHRIAAARTVPVSAIATRLRRAVRDAARSRQVQVRWTVVGGHVEVDGTVIRGVEDALLHLVRNSVAHGIEPPDVRRAADKDAEGEVRLSATSARGRVRLTVSDDGRGLDRERLLELAGERGLAVDDTDWTALVFRAGLSTAADVDHLAGRGVGMDVVAAAVRAVRGTVTVETAAGMGTSITLDLPTSLAVTRCVVVSAGMSRYAIPADDVAVVLGAPLPTESAGGHAVVRHGATSAPLVDLAVLLGGDPTPAGPTLLVQSAGRTVALRVAAVLRQADVTVQSRLAGTPPNELLLGTAIAGDGTALVVLDPIGLVRIPGTLDADQPGGGERAGETPTPTKHVLVVDDAMAVRELQRSVLERAGYRVTTAADGRQALAALTAGQPDLVVTDVEMPRMDGFALTEAIRQGQAPGTPVIILTTLDDETHQQRGADAGADAYLVKAEFTADRFLASVADQIGPP